MIAVNDGIILESCIYRILQRQFRQHPAYAQLLEIFHEVPCICTLDCTLACTLHNTLGVVSSVGYRV